MTAATYSEPFDFGKVALRAYDVIRRNLVLLSALSLLLYGIPKLGSTLLQFGVGDIPLFGAVFLITGAFYQLIAGLGYFVLQAAVVYVFVCDLNGRTPSLRGAVRVGLNAFLPLLLLFLVTAVAFLLGLVALVVPAFMILSAWLVAVPAAVVERLGVRAAIDRSVWLTRQYRWPAFAIVAFLCIATAIVNGAAGDYDYSGHDFLDLFNNVAHGLRALIEDLLEVVLALIATVTVSSVYFELRALKEGAEPEELAELLA